MTSPLTLGYPIARKRYQKRPGPPAGYRVAVPPSVPCVEIELTHGLFAYVSPDRFDEVMPFTWHAWWNANTKSYYAQTNIKRGGGPYGTLSMHRFLMGLGIGDPRKVDHKKHWDTLNNTTGSTGNLRLATQAEQARNRGKYENNTSGFIGVYPYGVGRFRARLRFNRELICLGIHESAIKAAKIRDLAALKHFG